MRHDEENQFSDKDALLANVALLYYGEGLTQNDIAMRMGVSRQTVVNMLRECRERAIVEIRVAGQVLASSNHSRMLKQKYGLADAYVARRHNGQQPVSDADIVHHVARIGAAALSELVQPNDVVGVAWGQTIMSVANKMSTTDVSNVTVCQMIGSMASDRVAASEDCAIRISQHLGAQCFTLHAPAVLSSTGLAATLRQEPTIATQLQRLETLDLALFSVSDTGPETHMVAAGIADRAELKAARQAGAVGVVCARYLNADGQAIKSPPNDRVIGITIDQLRNASRKLLVAAGVQRLEPVKAALKGKLVTHLCVDETLAKALLENCPEAVSQQRALSHSS